MVPWNRYFVNENGIKVKKENSCKYLQKKLRAEYLPNIVLRHIDRICYKVSLKKLWNAVFLNV